MKKTILRIMGIFGIIIIVALLLNIKTIRKLNHVITLFDEDLIVENFMHMEDGFDTHLVTASPNPTRLPERPGYTPPKQFSQGDSTFNTSDYMEFVNTTGLLVIHRDTIVHQSYYLGMTDSTTHISWSMAKSFISAMVGIAHRDNLFRSVDDPVTDYLPELASSGYDGVRIKDILQMSTGVGFNEDYRDFNSDINRFGRFFALGKSFDEFALSLDREQEPGTYNHYVSINTQVLGMLLTRITGKTIAEYTKEKIWDPAGMEYNAQWIIDKKGMELALGGLNATLRDYGKFGLVYLHNGRWQGKQIVPADWVQQSITPDAPHLLPGENKLSDSHFGYGYQWWIPENADGAFFAAGIYNQYTYIDPKRELVIVKLSANHHFKEADDQSKDIHVALLQAIARDFPVTADPTEADTAAVSIEE